jgi:D-glycero-alpha-D-manno-heptose-7-phosphate kinase
VIISRTPLRISLMGGGSDLAAFYGQETGAVVSTTIDKYIYITVNRAFDDTVRASYSRTEIVDDVAQLAHPLIREALRLCGVLHGVEITSIADVPSRGTGLGSSSAYLVGLLHALWAYQGVFKSQATLAEEACRIEIETLHESLGKQDQYIAAYGGLQHIRFNPDDTVFVDPVICRRETKRALQDHLLLFYTGITRSASEILARQEQQTDRKRDALREMVVMAEEVNTILRDGDDLDRIGGLLHRAWEIKRELAAGITNPEIDRMYAAARLAGARGGKITGAGGGGFLLLWVEPRDQARVRAALSPLHELPVRLEPQGSKIIYIEE